MANFDPMVSMLASGTWKNLRFFRRSSSLRDRDPAIKIICSTCHPWCCNVSPRDLRRDSHWFSARDLTRVRYWSVTSLIRLNSRMQNMPVFVSVGGRNTMSSGLSLQNLSCDIVSLLWTSSISVDSARVRGRFISRSLTAFHIESFVIFIHWRSVNSSTSSFFSFGLESSPKSLSDSPLVSFCILPP